MENTLLPGDKIVVNKLVIGPQTPKSPFDIPWVNLLIYSNKQARAHIDSSWWKPVRLGGWSKIKRNDVLVFKNEHLSTDYFIKRCVALPGDELQIVDSKVVIDGKCASVDSLSDIKKQWALYIINYEGFTHIADSLKINTKHHYDAGMGLYTEMSLTNQQAAIFRQSHYIDSMCVKIKQPHADAWLRPFGKRNVWSIDNYGPIQIPYEGWQIRLSDETLPLYFETIRDWENKVIETIDGKFYIDSKKVINYTFENNYYMMMGDNRHNSADSRMWGFLPEQCIVGKATSILWSNKYSKMKWSRIMKKIK